MNERHPCERETLGAGSQGIGEIRRLKRMQFEGTRAVGLGIDL